ncbi:Cadmium, zinc and cobalt-transporting ATPase [[Clostridium] cellulosi]|uniref:Cadmium, zinc and cobalt-transporting ATPase n=1 Tax=[Clostridium] cellulosi TaxID=29343 RepID=A0A078KLX1_9FIRM|nr:Cadmium, zinc and cobalt-transporting ATPase [[Clostridium] cellulosi]
MKPEIRKEYILENLCCGNCAAKIEREAGTISGVVSSNVDFVSKTLTLEIERQINSGTLFDEIDSIVKRHDSAIVVKEKEQSEPGKKVIYLSGIDCNSCAEKIEEEVKKISGVKSANLDIATQRLTVEADDKGKLPVVLRAVYQKIREMEPNVEISYTQDSKKTESADLKKQFKIISLIFGTALFVIGMVFTLPAAVEFVLYLIAYLAVGGEILFKALRNIAKGQVFDENFLMSVATIGAFAIGEYPEGVAVMLFYQIGELLQDAAVDRSRKSISALMDIRPDYANLKIGDEIRRVAPEEAAVGDLIVVRPGERIPLDGRVVEGKSSLDMSALTGESLPRDVEAGSSVLSGSVNKTGLITVEVTSEYGESTVSKILNLVQNASSKKAPTENFITKFARIYTPVVVFTALALALIPPLVIPGVHFAEWIKRGLIFLVISCPCAIVVSIPLCFFGGIGGASKNGILVKGSNFLEALNNVDTVVFDKTGTLTKGNFKVAEIKTANGFTEDEVLSLAAYAENYSNHPIAVSIRESYGKEIDSRRISDYEELSGKGIRVKIDGKTVLAGNSSLMKAENIACEKIMSPGTVVYIATDGKFAGYLVIADEIRPDSEKAIQELKAAGVKTAMLTGDSKAAGELAGKELGLDQIYTELLPHQKVEQLERLSKAIDGSGKLVFIGDGINDAPVLAQADVGIAMGGTGSDAAIEAADVVFMTDEPKKIVTAINIARRTHKIVWQNIIFALVVKAALLILGALGVANMWEAVFGDVGVTLIAVLNATRTMRTENRSGFSYVPRSHFVTK